MDGSDDDIRNQQVDQDLLTRVSPDIVAGSEGERKRWICDKIARGFPVTMRTRFVAGDGRSIAGPNAGHLPILTRTRR